MPILPYKNIKHHIFEISALFTRFNSVYLNGSFDFLFKTVFLLLGIRFMVSITIIHFWTDLPHTARKNRLQGQFFKNDRITKDYGFFSMFNMLYNVSGFRCPIL